MSLLFLIGSIGISLLYALLLERYRLAWRKLESLPTNPSVPPVSVTILIAARNEVHRILPLLDSLHHLDYPGDLDIIIVDDHSTDGTFHLVKKHLPPHTRLLTSVGNGKRAALLTGLQAARGDILLLTDADCRMDPGWVSAMTMPFADPYIHWVSGPVASADPSTLSGRYDALEWHGLMVLTGAGFASGHPVLAQGANMAFRKTDLESIGALSGLPERASGDDLFLLALFHRHYPLGCRFQKDARAMVRTMAPISWQALLRQRLRWTSKSAHLDLKHGQAPMALTWLACLVILTTPVLLSFLPPTLAALAILPLLIKGLAEYRLLHAGWTFTGIRPGRLDFILASLVQPVLVVISGVVGPLRPNYLWKGRRVQ